MNEKEEKEAGTCDREYRYDAVKLRGHYPILWSYIDGYAASQYVAFNLHEHGHMATTQLQDTLRSAALSGMILGMMIFEQPESFKNQEAFKRLKSQLLNYVLNEKEEGPGKANCN